MYRRLKCNKYEIQSETTSSQLPNMAKMTSGRKPDEKLKKKKKISKYICKLHIFMFRV